MGQCYSVYLKAKLKDADAFVRLTREFAKDWSQEFKDKLTGIGGIINNFVGDGAVRVVYEDGWPVFCGDFDASYSWDGVMSEWFEAVSPSLVDGSSIEVWPDEGSWKRTVVGGEASETEYGECDDEEEDGDGDDE
jgi:hypothetical protein